MKKFFPWFGKKKEESAETNSYLNEENTNGEQSFVESQEAAEENEINGEAVAKDETAENPAAPDEVLNEPPDVFAADADKPLSEPAQDTQEDTESAQDTHEDTESAQDQEVAEAFADGGDDSQIPSHGKPKKIRKRWSKKKKIIVFSILGVLVAAIATAGIYIAVLYNNPMSAFTNVAAQMSASASASQTASSSQSSATPTITDPEELLRQKADQSVLTDIVNILLIGVDHADERESWKGKKAFHADVMIVLAINTKTNKVTMISIPRDTWVEMPGVKGYYKANACIDCGGGWPTDGGFKKACELAEWMIGGFAIDYYYAVDMEAVKGLVNTVNGVDFDLDITFDLMGRKYTKGQQHMDGQAVLDYLRVRKDGNIDGSDETGDLNRINRQKKMLVAIFEKIKKQDLLIKLPDMLKSFDGSLYTNTSFAQTAALALFMKNVDSAGIEMKSMEGTYDKLFFELRYVFTNQAKRIALIQEVYGQTVEATKYTHGAAVSKWAHMRRGTITRKASSVLSKVKSKLDADAKLPVYTPPTDGSAVPSKTPSGYRQYGSSWHSLYSSTLSMTNALSSKSGSSLYNAEESVISNISKLCKKFGISTPSYGVSANGYNEVDVDPR
jgi:LCP family protein required for cell wall assembly